MNTLNKNKILIKSLGFGSDKFFVELNNGKILAVPYSYTKRLSKASLEELQEYHIIGGGRGIHFPLIDEDISTEGIIRDFGDEVNINISLPLFVLNKIDNIAQENNISRSNILEKASIEYIKNHSKTI